MQKLLLGDIQTQVDDVCMFAFAWWFVKMVLNTAVICSFIEIIAKVLNSLEMVATIYKWILLIETYNQTAERTLLTHFYMSFLS